MGKPQGFARMPSRRHGAALHMFRHGSSHFILGHFPSLYLTAIVKTEAWTAGLQQCWLKDRARRSSQVTDGRTANMSNCLTSTWDGTNKKPSLQLEAVWRKWRNLKPRAKGQKQAGRVKGEGRCGERTVCEEWGDTREVENIQNKSNDANDADGEAANDAADADDADATMSPGWIEPRQNCL